MKYENFAAVLPGCAQKTNGAPPATWARPCAFSLRHYVGDCPLLCCKADRQASSCRDSRECWQQRTGSCLESQKCNVFRICGCNARCFSPLSSFADHTVFALLHAWDYRSLDLKWLLVAASSQWLPLGLLSCGLSVVTEPVAWSSPEEAPLCWMDVCEAAPNSELPMKAVIKMSLGFYRQRLNWSWMFGLYRPPVHGLFPHTTKIVFLKNWTPLEQFMTVRKTLNLRPPAFYSQLTLAS